MIFATTASLSASSASEIPTWKAALLPARLLLGLLLGLLIWKAAGTVGLILSGAPDAGLIVFALIARKREATA